MNRKKTTKILVPVIVIAVVAVVVLGYFGYLPFFNNPNFGFPSSSQMTQAAGNGKTYNQSGSPHQASGGQSSYSGVSSAQELNYTSQGGAFILVIELKFSSSSGAQSEYTKTYAEIKSASTLGGVLSSSTSISANITYRGFTYFSYQFLGEQISFGYDGAFVFMIFSYSGTSSISIDATSNAVVSAMY